MKKLYVIKDVEAQSCGPVMDIKNDVVAKRFYKKCCEEQKFDSSVFRLYCLGAFDEERGLITETYVPAIDITADTNAEENE